jgi:hypothetical protein
MRARERLQSATPICDDASLLELEEDVAEYVREAKRRDALGPDELISTVVDEAARNYFRHVLRKQNTDQHFDMRIINLIFGNKLFEVCRALLTESRRRLWIICHWFP